MIKFCPLIKGDCRTNCMFKELYGGCSIARISYVLQAFREEGIDVLVAPSTGMDALCKKLDNIDCSVCSIAGAIEDMTEESNP